MQKSPARTRTIFNFYAVAVIEGHMLTYIDKYDRAGEFRHRDRRRTAHPAAEHACHSAAQGQLSLQQAGAVAQGILADEEHPLKTHPWRFERIYR